MVKAATQVTCSGSMKTTFSPLTKCLCCCYGECASKWLVHTAKTNMGILQASQRDCKQCRFQKCCQDYCNINKYRYWRFEIVSITIFLSIDTLFLLAFSLLSDSDTHRHYCSVHASFHCDDDQRYFILGAFVFNTNHTHLVMFIFI